MVGSAVGVGVGVGVGAGVGAGSGEGVPAGVGVGVSAGAVASPPPLQAASSAVVKAIDANIVFDLECFIHIPVKKSIPHKPHMRLVISVVFEDMTVFK